MPLDDFYDRHPWIRSAVYLVLLLVMLLGLLLHRPVIVMGVLIIIGGGLLSRLLVRNVGRLQRHGQV